MAQGLRVAKRYAQALFDSVTEPQSEIVRVALQALSDAWRESADFRQMVNDPLQLPDERKKVFLSIIDSTGLLAIEPLKALLELLIQRSRVEILPALAVEFSRLSDERMNMRSFIVAAPRELTEGEKRNITDRLAQKMSGTVHVEWIVDETMIAGLQIRSGDKLIDRSLGGALERLAAHLISNN